MPKDREYIASIQKGRIKIKQKNAKYAPGRVSIHCLGTGAKGAPKAMYLFSDQSRYLFNCGEGTQRLAHEHKVKLSKLEHIFITQPVWENIGGLPGTALTIQDVGVPQITLHGPPSLSEIFAATKRFVILRNLKIVMAKSSQETMFEDNVIKVKYIPLSKKFEQNVSEQIAISMPTSSGNNIVEDDIDYYAHECSGKSKKLEIVSSVSQNLLLQQKEMGNVMSYICQLQARPGALNLDACVRKGVPPGPLLGRLKNGEDIVLANGTVVASSQVREPDDPGPVFLVVDCPSVDYLDNFVNNREFKKHQKFAGKDDEAAFLVVHFTPQEVMQHPDYKKWMDDFIPSTQHICLNESNVCLGSVAVHRIQYKLNLLSPTFFPLLGSRGAPLTTDGCESRVSKKPKYRGLELENLKIEPVETKSDENSRVVNTLACYHLRPTKGFDSSSEIRLDPQEYIDETLSLEDFPNVLKELQQKLSAKQSVLSIREFPKVLFLGTGSCIPNKTRNTSGILVQTSESKSILLDCGEGTYGQLVRFFGPDMSREVLASIDAIYISHLHADHHIGLIGMLQGRKRALEELNKHKSAVYLFAPHQILTWLDFYDKFFESIGEEYMLIPNADLVMGKIACEESKRVKILNNLELKDICTCGVQHCPNAFGLSITHKDGYKITYSGDTMPSENLVKLGMGSDVLIHEATMEDDLGEEAVTKMHSTTSQAIQIGKRMSAKHIILTHFSQRYAKLPRFNDNFDDNVCIAFDNMQIRLDELPLVPNLYPALKVMFAEQYEELEHKAVKRQRRLEKDEAVRAKTLSSNLHILQK
ncbi:ribonuclease Z, mitochondrial isoform X2 [Cylas formicarius]|nr:ribonuclease Z, mitochondrial isoform X2 [Cylas formicarius]